MAMSIYANLFLIMSYQAPTRFHRSEWVVETLLRMNGGRSLALRSVSLNSAGEQTIRWVPSSIFGLYSIYVLFGIFVLTFLLYKNTTYEW